LRGGAGRGFLGLRGLLCGCRGLGSGWGRRWLSVLHDRVSGGFWLSRALLAHACFHNLLDLGHCAHASIPAHQFLRYGLNDFHSPGFDFRDLLARDCVVPHVRVHRGGHDESFGRVHEIPRPGGARQKIVAKAVCDFCQGVGRERGDEEGLCPLPQFYVGHWVPSPPPDGPLLLVRVNRAHLLNLFYVEEMLRVVSTHDLHFKSCVLKSFHKQGRLQSSNGA